MLTEQQRRLALDLLTGKRTFAEAPNLTEQESLALIRRYLAEKADPGPARADVDVRTGATILRDDRGIPHISADNTYDLFFAHGYAQAQDRLWQLDYLRRWAHGRLAEIYGRAKRDDDIAAHTLGISSIAAAALAASHPDCTEMFEAFSDGINAWISALPAGLPVEFELFDYQPESWSPVDSVAIYRRWFWYLTGRLPVISNPECVRAVIGEREADFYQPDGEVTYIVPPGNYDPEPRWPGLPMAEAADLAWGPQEPGGSNNWVIAPDISADGSAMAGSDPHVYYGVPSDFYEVHLRGAGFDVVGSMYAGTPIPRLGRNRDLAWGITNNICMQRDLYVERIDPTDSDRYLDGDTWTPMERRRVEIAVRDEDPHQIDIRFAHGRPIVDHLVAEAALPRNLWDAGRGADTALSLAWVGFEVSDEPKAFLDLARAGSVEEGRQALASIRCPTWNYVLADRAGSIAYQCTGALPLRGRTYRGYRDANDSFDAWVGYIPFAGLPRIAYPASGHISSANNPTAPPDFPYPLFGTWTVEDRAARAELLLGELKPHTAATFAAMQNDVFSGRAERGTPALLAVMESSGKPAFEIPAQILRAWNYQYSVDAAGASIFAVFFWRWHQHVVRLRFPEHLAKLVQDSGWGLSSALLHGDPSGWFDSNAQRLESMANAVNEAIDWLTERLGNDPNGWSWGRIHRLGAAHPAARTALQHELFDLPPQPHPGGPGTLNSAFYLPPGSFDTRVGPIYRLIASLGPASHTETVSWPGQSGHAGSPHYADQVDRHIAGEYYGFPFAWEDVVHEAISETILRPAS